MFHQLKSVVSHLGSLFGSLNWYDGQSAMNQLYDVIEWVEQKKQEEQQ